MDEFWFGNARNFSTWVETLNISWPQVGNTHKIGSVVVEAVHQVLVQAEVGRNHADVEFAIWGGVSDKKRPACK